MFNGTTFVIAKGFFIINLKIKEASSIRKVNLKAFNILSGNKLFFDIKSFLEKVLLIRY